MNFSVACNWDPKLPLALSRFKEVKVVFGSSGNDIIGGGRIRRVISDVEPEQLERFVEECHRYNLMFQYLVTAPGLGNREYDGETRRDILNYIGFLRDAKVDSLSIGNPYLIDLVKRHFPDIRIKASIFLDVNSVRQAKFYQSKGVNALVLPFNYTRDFRFLTELRKAVSLELQLFVNNTCLNFCPYSFAHALALGYGSQKYFYKRESDLACVDICTLHCRQQTIENPEALLKVNWIRPEDLSIYEEMGYDWFKITDRSVSTPTLTKFVSAYANRKWDGNLVEILSEKGPLASPERFDPAVVSRNKELLFNTDLRAEQRLSIGVDCFDEAEPHIDNSKLGSFLVKTAETDCRRTACSDCRYCKSVSKDAVHMSPKSRELAEMLTATTKAFYRSWETVSEK